MNWIKLYRSIVDHPVFAHPTALKIWVWMLCRASTKNRSVNIGGQIVNLEPGQFIFGRLKAEDQLGIDGSTIYKWLKKFEEPEPKGLGLILCESSSRMTIVSICNWDTYQAKKEKEEQPSSSRVAAEEQLRSSRVAAEEHKQDSIDSKESKESESTHAHTREEVNHEKTETHPPETGEQKKDTPGEKVTPVAGSQNNIVRNTTETEQQKIERIEGLARQYELEVVGGSGKEGFVRQLRLPGRNPNASMQDVLKMLPGYSAWWVTRNVDKTYTGYLKAWEWYLQDIHKTFRSDGAQNQQSKIYKPFNQKKPDRS